MCVLLRKVRLMARSFSLLLPAPQLTVDIQARVEQSESYSASPFRSALRCHEGSCAWLGNRFVMKYIGVIILKCFQFCWAERNSACHLLFQEG